MINPYMTCDECKEYRLARRYALAPALGEKVARTGRDVNDVVDEYMGKVHERHLSGPVAGGVGMTAPIRIVPGQLGESLNLIRSSALDSCVTVDGDDAGIFVARNWPTLSSGEEVLWSLLAWLNGSGECPSVVDLADNLDPANLLAAMDARDIGLGVAR